MFDFLKKKVMGRHYEPSQNNECNHQYVYYNNSLQKHVSTIHSTTNYHFVCRNCKDVIKINQREIQDRVEIYNEDYLKNKAIGEMNEVFEDEFSLYIIGDINMLYRSPGASLTIQYYKSRGIDIKSLGKKGSHNKNC